MALTITSPIDVYKRQPLEADSGFPEGGQEGNSFVLEESAKFNIPTGEGKNGRNSVPVFTDWKRLRMVFDEKWNGMIEEAGGMIEVFDYAINPTESVSYTHLDVYKRQGDNVRRQTLYGW